VEHVLGKVTGSYGQPTGPDAVLDIVVDPRWLREARTIEVDLPRHLSCAACKGAGCDICAQSGALTVRERFEPAEVVRLTLPTREIESEASADSQRTSLLLRVQGRGGLPQAGSGVTERGRLLLRINCAGSVSECVREVANEEITSLSPLHRANLVNYEEGVPSSATSPTGGVRQPLVSRDVAPSPEVPAPSLPVTRRSYLPEPIGNEPTPNVESPAAPARPARAERRHGIRWLDVAIGLFVVLLGAAAAWFLL